MASNNVIETYQWLKEKGFMIMATDINTAESLTDEQIRELRNIIALEAVNGLEPERMCGWIVCDLALQRRNQSGARSAQNFEIDDARARCAEILNARDTR